MTETAFPHDRRRRRFRLRSSLPRVGLFVTCLVDLFRPTVGFAAVRTCWKRRAAGSRCRTPRPAAASRPGIPATRRDTAENRQGRDPGPSEGFDYVVAPSGSCAGMIKHHYLRLFENDCRMGAAGRTTWRSGRTSWSASWSTCAGWRGVDAPAFRPAGDLSRQLLRPAGTRRQAAAAPPARVGRRAGAAGTAGGGSVLRLRRHLLHQVSPEISNKNGIRQGGRHRRHRRRARSWPATWAAF